MKHPVALLSTGVLILLLGAVVPTFAQERHEQEAKAPKQAEQAKPEKQAKPAKEQARTQPSQAKQQPQGQQKQEKVQQQAKGQGKQQKAQQQQAKSQENQQKAHQQQAKGQEKQQKVQQQPKAMVRQERSSQRPQRTAQDEARQRPSRHCDSAREVKVAYLMTAFALISGAGTNSASAVQEWLTDIPASSTAASGLDLFSRGRMVGTTPTTFTLITLTANISSSIRIIPVFALPLA